MRFSLSIVAALAGLGAGQTVQTFLNDNPATAPFWRLLRDYQDVVTDLENASELTLLVPSGAALDALDLEAQNDTEIENLLRYHVLEGSYSAEELAEAAADSPFLPTLLTGTGVSGGQRVQIRGGGESLRVFAGLNSNATVDADNSDLQFDSGYAHIVDSVLTVPQSILDTALAAGLTSFAGAVNSSSIDVLAENDCTFFVPSNEAFARVGSIFQNASSEAVDELVLYHFINDTTPIYTPRIDHEQWISALRENVTFSYPAADELFINSARVTQANILVENGVVYVLDQVLNPADAGGDPPAEAQSSPAYPDAESVEEAPFTDELDDSESEPTATVGEGPDSTPAGTLDSNSEESAPAENSGRRLTTSLQLAGVGIAWTIWMV